MKMDDVRVQGDKTSKNKRLLVCVDSDGCAMDTMNDKHIHCFGPTLVEEWELDCGREGILKRWNEINLYRLTRGINRFQGLARMLREVDASICAIPGLAALEQWVEESDELSETSLKKELGKNDSPCLRKALVWSERVNEKIRSLPEDSKQPFPGVKMALEEIKRQADIVVVSSANRQALQEEWEANGFMQYVNLLLAQDMGSKSVCIERVLKEGYERLDAMMIGDSVGDWEAAKENGIFFYPILVGQEEKSWSECQQIALQRLKSGTFAGEYQKKKTEEFLENLSE